MAATEDVLQLLELLQMILLRLRANEIITSKRVSKFWHDLIETSFRLRSAQVLKAPSNPLMQPRDHDHVYKYFPHHVFDDKIGIHPDLHSTAFDIDLSDERTAYHIFTDHWTARRLSPVEQQFTTLPPCQRILIEGGDPLESVYCEVYVKSRVRIQDLIKVEESMGQSCVQYPEEGTPAPKRLWAEVEMRLTRYTA